MTTTTTTTTHPQITYTKTKEIPYAKSLQEFLEIAKNNEPVAYRVKSQDKNLPPAFQKWDEQFFASSNIEAVGHKVTSNRVLDLVNNSIWEMIGSARKHAMTIGEFVQKQQQHRKETPNSPIGSLLLSGTEMYIRDDYVDQPRFQQLLPDLEHIHQFIPIENPKDDIRTMGLWMSGKGMSSQTHFDSSGDHNMNFQVCGSKLCTLYEPNDGVQNLYPLPGKLSILSSVDPYHPNVLDSFPRVQQTTPHVIELKEGEILYIPALWWHDIRHLGDFNINVTTWYQSERRPKRQLGGPYFLGNWRDTMVAWFYLLKVVLAFLIAKAIEILTIGQCYPPEANEERKKTV